MDLPPPVENALGELLDIGALTEDEKLSRLGKHLAAFPLPPRVGKMLLYAAVFGCLDPVLTVACASAYRDPWVMPTDAGAKRASDATRAEFAAAGGGCSDHLAVVAAYGAWKEARNRGGDFGFCRAKFLSPSTMNMLDGMRRQLVSELDSMGIVPAASAAHSSQVFPQSSQQTLNPKP